MTRNLLLALGLLAAGFASASRAATVSPLAPFFARLDAGGRAEVRIAKRASSAEGEERIHGRAALEPPDLARLDFDETGERVTLRADGGEWLQPRLRQLVRLDPAQARVALEWWDLLLGRDRDAFVERALAPRRVLLLKRVEGAAPDSAWVTLDQRGLPTRLAVHQSQGMRAVFELSRWRFGGARGRTAFVIAPPVGYDVVDLP